MLTKPPISILLLAYPTFNTLDLNGPLEVLGNFALQSNPFTLTIAASTEHTVAAESVVIQRHISIPIALARLEEFDVLIQPGGLSQPLLDHLKPGDDTYSGLLEVIATFTTLGHSERLGGNRIIMSICTGAFFLGYAGVFEGISATTHFLALRGLQELCDGYNARRPGSKPTAVVPDPNKKPDTDFRYVMIQDGRHEKVRVISSGGISCALDASLYLVELLKGREKADEVARIMQYAWRRM
jgi:transcriptional regulator GlxA family with amidase domain